VQQVFKADPTEHFDTDAISHTIDDFRTVLGRCDMDAEGSLSERLANDIDDGDGSLPGIHVGRPAPVMRVPAVAWQLIPQAKGALQARTFEILTAGRAGSKTT